MISAIVSRLVILLFGTLYPAYASYKAVRTKNVKEYVKWMMYWIVFAFFTCIETFTDILLSWFPFYYEIKVIIVLWLLSPATRGSSTLYRKFVHPMLTRREQEIDDYINQAKEKGYTAVLQLGSKGVNYATNVIMQTAIKAFGTKAHTPVHGMMRLSQSDNSLLIAATAAASMVGHAGPSRSAIHAREHRDEHDGRGGVGGGGDIIASPPPYDSTVATLSRVRRSQSVDSALNRSTAAVEGRSTRSSTSRSVTRDGAATTINQHAIIYELDSEEEEAERFLATETEYLLQDADSSQRNVEGVAQRSRRAAAGRAAVTIAAAINADDSDDGGSTRSAVSVGGTSKVTKRKPTAQMGTERAKKKSNVRSASTEPAAATTAALTKSTTSATTSSTGTATRGRKKVRKDSGSATDGMEVE
ncbi:receptor expression-enhancing protein 3 isoform X2 [Anopheles aquasalis]|uniref:receptor expression-enhancing protein 3 isoform X2 n=1 Tax=Anopheles aquasalis TaxID=42839 RepID=UPI00215B28AC|nr:receptor expression-enhancing protein 3 isoform X2 [Anopheles aquasalis]